MMRQVGYVIALCLLCALPVRMDAQCRFMPIDSLPLPMQEPVLVAALQQNEACRHWVDSVMQTMSLKERIGQLFIYTIAPQINQPNRNLLKKVVQEYKVGGLLFSGGLLENQVKLTNEAQQLAKLPLFITFDGEWGLAMRLKGTPSFPRNMVLGCIRSDSLLYEYGREVARQCREIGVQINFAPVADVNINPDNPVINTRSFGEIPAEVARKVVAYSRGLESGRVLSVSKHFPGHGDTNVDSHKALPILSFTRERLDSVELYPFRRAIRAGLGGIMVGHLEVPALEPQQGVPSSLSRRIVTEVLKEELGFKGLVFTDALAMRGVGNPGRLCLEALKAGDDLLLVPRALGGELDVVWKAVRQGELPETEINRKCRKVLTYKYALGLTCKPQVQLSGLESRLNTPHARALIRHLREAAITVVDSGKGLLPLDRTSRRIAVLQVGNAEALSPFMKECSRDVRMDVFRLTKDMSVAAMQTLKKKLENYERVIFCISDRHLEGYRPFFTRHLPDADRVYLLFISGHQVPRDFGAAPDALVLAHSAESDVQLRVAALLTGKAGADGRLSARVGDWFSAGAGKTLEVPAQPYRSLRDLGVDADRLSAIDRIAEEGIREGAYPGCQVVVMKEGYEIYNKAFGTHYGRAEGDSMPVSKNDVYDIASLTKTSATLLAVMKLYDQGRLSLTDRVSDYLPFLMDTDKRDITVRQLLLHESGLPSTILFYRDAIDEDSYEGSLFRGTRDANHTARIGGRTWANPDFDFHAGLTSPMRTDSCTWQLADSLWLNPRFKEAYLQQIADAPLLSRRYRYSCVGFILLQQLVEARAGLPMDEFLEREFYRPMGLTHTGYHPLSRLPRQTIIPSSVDNFLRKDTLQGFVHDESAAFLGGVAGNAGLFSNAHEQALLYQMLLNGGTLDGHRYLSPETCRVFTTTLSRTSRRGLGFDKPDRRNPRRSPCCEEAPASVYGHTGFTGTCAWVDPDNKLVYVFLSNRIFPHVWNNKLSRLDIRTRIQQAVYKALH